MSERLRMPLLFWIVFAGIFLLVTQAQAAAPLAKITGFKGEVIVLSEKGFKDVTAPGVELFDGERIQTKDGSANVVFADGSSLDVRPFTSILIQEQEESSGFLFKTKSLVRRITCMVGTLQFKSGSSKAKTFLQSPTTVCGLRGTDMKFGFDNVNTYLQQIEGAAEIAGPVVQGFFNDLGQNPAMNSTVYNKMTAAHEADKKAQETGSTDLDKATAKVATLDAVKTSVEAILQNPNLPEEQKTVLNQVLQKVTTDLQNATEQLSTITPTTVPGESTTVAEETTSVVEQTTSIIGETTTVEEMTTTAPPPTVTTTFAIPTTTTTQGVSVVR